MFVAVEDADDIPDVPSHQTKSCDYCKPRVTITKEGFFSGAWGREKERKSESSSNHPDRHNRVRSDLHLLSSYVAGGL